MKKTPEEINAEIKTLESIKPNVRRSSSFGDNNHAAIDGQLKALRGKWDENDVYDADMPENVTDAAIEAVSWVNGDEEMSPSESWKPLIEE